MTNEEILSVPDMSEEEQWKWLEDNCLSEKDYVYAPDFEGYQLDKKAALADLAFRLRDEASINYLPEAMCLVHECVDKGVDKMYQHSLSGGFSWFCFLAQPIHWICAALIAKNLAKEKE